MTDEPIMTAAGRPVDRSQPPGPGPVRPFSFPPFQHRELSCGIQVLLARLPRVPMVTLELYIPAGGQYDPAELPGLATLTAGMLDEGTRQRSATEIAALVEQLGGSLITGAGWNAIYASTSALAKDLPTAVDLAAELVLEPSFPADELERLRRQRLGDLLQRRNDPSSLAQERFSAAIYGDSPYGRSLIGDETSAQAITGGDVRGFYSRHVTAPGTAIVAVGDLDPDALVEHLESAFRSMPRHQPPPMPEIGPRSLDGVEIHLVHRPQAAQTEMRVGHVGISRTHPEYLRLQVLNAILGGKFTSRINLNLRERHGYTYGAHSRFIGRFGPGPFQVSSAVETEVAGAAVRETLGEIRRIQEDLVSEEELADTQSYLRGAFVGQLQTIDELSARLSALALYGLPADYYERYLREIETTTREDLLTLARQYLQPERAVVVLVGPREALEPQVEGLGEVFVHEPPPKVSNGG
ncbi:MAG: pitrilysin family protein [Acidobacteriota bacterium]|nr:pitrilysin family protein [Acidobacteriota bacterium]